MPRTDPEQPFHQSADGGQVVSSCGRRTNKTYSFYINGVLQASKFVHNMGAISCDSHTIGDQFDNGGLYYNHYLDGAVDEMRIYNRALSAAEVLALYTQTGASP